MVAKGTGRWVYFSFSGGSSPPPAAGSCLSFSPSTIGRKALRFVLLCSRLVKKVLTSALHCSNYYCAAVNIVECIVEWCGSVCTSRHAEQPWYCSWHPQRWVTLPRNERKCAKAFDPRATTQEYGHPGPSAEPEFLCPAGGARLVPRRLSPRRPWGLGKGTAGKETALPCGPTGPGGGQEYTQRPGQRKGRRARARDTDAARHSRG